MVNASKSIMHYAKKKLQGTRYDVMNSPIVYGVNSYYLPDVGNIKVIENNNYDFRLIDSGIQSFYKYKGIHNVLQYDVQSERPEVLAAVAYANDRLFGIACASADSKTMWQIGVDVLPEYRGNELAVKFVNMITIEIFKREIVPYYTTDNANINS